MQLNNLETGECIILLDAKKEGMIFNIYESGLKKKFIQKSNGLTFDENFVSENPLSYKDLKTRLSLEVIQLSYPQFILSDDEKNWCVQNGSEGNETLYRVFIPNDLEKWARANRPNNPLYDIIKFCENNLPANTSRISESGIIQYLETLLPEHRIILEQYETIIIDSKYKEITGNINLV